MKAGRLKAAAFVVFMFVQILLGSDYLSAQATAAGVKEFEQT